MTLATRSDRARERRQEARANETALCEFSMQLLVNEIFLLTTNTTKI